MGVKVAFRETAAEIDDAPQALCLVPRAAVVNEGDRRVVFAVNGENVERRAVSVGRELGSDIEILAGLSAGALVVVEGPEGLEDGQKVKIEN